MLDGKSEVLDLEDIGRTAATIEVEAEGMGGELGQQARGEAPETLGVVDLQMELLGQLAVDRLDDLAGPIEHLADRLGHRLPGVAPRQGEQLYAVLRPQARRHRLADEGLVAQGGQIGVLRQQLFPGLQLPHIGRGQQEIEDDSGERHQQVQLVAEDGALLGGHAAEAGLVGLPVGPIGHGHQVESDDGDGQAVQDAPPVLGQIQPSQHQPPHVR